MRIGPFEFGKTSGFEDLRKKSKEADQYLASRPVAEAFPTPISANNVVIPYFPRPLIELYDVAHYSDTMMNIFNSLASETFRQGFEIKEKWAQKCGRCGKEFEAEKERCDKCGSFDLKTPDEKQKETLKKFLRKVNSNGHDLRTLSQILKKDVDIADDIFVNAQLDYLYDASNRIAGTNLVEIIRVHPAKIRFIADKSGRLGVGDNGKRKMFCPAHRSDLREEDEYCPTCGKEMLNACYEADGPGDTQKYLYYSSGEICHASQYNPSMTNGFPPLFSCWLKVSTLLAQDKYINDMYTKQRPPRGLLLLKTTNFESIKKVWAWMLDMMKQNPHMIPPLPIETDQAGQFAQFVDFMRSLDEMQFTEMREEYRKAIGAVWGVMPIFQADVSASGGLNNEGHQITVTNRATENGQLPFNESLYPRMCEWLKVTDYDILVKPSEEKDEMAEKQRKQMDIQNAATMQAMGFEVTLNTEEEFEFGPMDVPVESPAKAFGAGMPGMEQPGMPQIPKVPKPGAMPTGAAGAPPAAAAAPAKAPKAGFTGEPAETTKSLKKKSMYLAKDKVYLNPGEKPPGELSVYVGSHGGRFYYTEPGGAPSSSPSTPSLPPEAATKVEKIRGEYEKLEPAFQNQLEEIFPKHEVATRTKSIESAAEKLERKSGSYSGVEDIKDMLGGKVIFDNLKGLQKGIEAIRKNFKVLEEDDYLKSPKGYYSAYHFTVDMNGKPAEIQLKTAAQNKIANIGHALVYKAAKLDKSQREKCIDYLTQCRDFALGRAKERPECMPIVSEMAECF